MNAPILPQSGRRKCRRNNKTGAGRLWRELPAKVTPEGLCASATTNGRATTGGTP